MANAAPVSVVVVNFNGGELVKRSVAAVLASSGAEVQVTVSDNGSSDGSLHALESLAAADKRVRVIANGANLGFAAGCNRALPLTDPGSEFVLFLNPDCVIDAGAAARMRAVMREHPEAGMAGCLIRNPDGSEQRGCRRNLPTPSNALARVLRLDGGFDLTGTPLPAEPAEVEAISGAFMFVRKTAMAAVGPLDEGYFLHCEDLDWCTRFGIAGWKILFVPDAIAVHVQGASSRRTPVKVEFHKHRGMLRYYAKFQGSRYPLPLHALVVVAVWLHFVLKAAWLVLTPWGRR